MTKTSDLDQKTEYTDDWERRRREVYWRDGYRCQNCGEIGGAGGTAELNTHHVVPDRRGGFSHLKNLVTSCKNCHEAAHDITDAPTGLKHLRNYGLSKLDEGFQDPSHYDNSGAFSDLDITDALKPNINVVRELWEVVDGFEPSEMTSKRRDRYLELLTSLERLETVVKDDETPTDG